MGLRAFTVAITLACWFITGRADEVISEYDIGFDVEITSTIVSSSSGNYTVDADLGSLSSSQRGRATIHLQNPFTFPIVIKAVRASCGCTRAKLADSVLPPGESRDLEIDIRTPDRSRDAHYVGVIVLDVDRDLTHAPGLQRIQIRLSYHIDGLLCFVDRMRTYGFADGESIEIKIPFLATLPSDLSELQLIKSGCMENAEASIVLSNRQLNYVKVTGKSSLASSEGSYGRLTIHDPAHDVSDAIDLVLFSQQHARISPVNLRFYRDGEAFQATAILQVHEANESQDGKTSSTRERHVYCEATLDGQPVKVLIQKIASDVHRLRVRIDSERAEIYSALPAEQRRLKWKVATGKRAYRLETSFVTLETD